MIMKEVCLKWISKSL